MPAAESYSSGYEEGYNDAYTEGYEEGYEEAAAAAVGPVGPVVVAELAAKSLAEKKAGKDEVIHAVPAAAAALPAPAAVV